MQSWQDVEAYNAGFVAASKGRRQLECPHPESSPRYDVWLDGWKVWFNLSKASKTERELRR